jgi:DNA end-binding protein Ku
MFTELWKRPGESTTDSSALPTVAAGPQGRPSWSGLLRLSLVAVPVKAYPTRSSTAGVHFHQLHADCSQRINHQKRCPAHGPVENAAIVRGYQYARDQYVVVEPEELDKVRPAKDKALVLEHFVDVHQVDPVLFAGRSLYLLPDGMAARHPYGVLAEALEKAGKWALGRVVLSAQRQLVLVRPRSNLLVMDLLHYPAEIRPSPTGQAGLPGGAATAEEIQMTRTLIEARSGPCDWSRYRDETTEELTALIDAKVAGQPLAAPAEEPVAALRLLDALKESVAAIQADPQVAETPRRKARSSRRDAG